MPVRAILDSLMLPFHGIDLIGPHAVKFCVESKHSCPTTSTRVFIERVADALRDMREICLSANKRDEESDFASESAESTDMPNTNADNPSRIRQLVDSVLAKPRL